MPQACKICTGPNRDSINSDLIAGKKKLDIVKAYNISYTNISNHLPHIRDLMTKSNDKQANYATRSIMMRISRLCDYVEQVVEELKLTDKYGLKLKSIRTAVDSLMNLGRLTGEVKDGNTTNIQVNVYDIMPKVMEILEIYPQARQAVIDGVTSSVKRVT